MAVPNDTTKFCLAFLIIWIVLTFILLVLVFLRKLSLPALVPKQQIMTYVFAFLQTAIFAMYLAAMAYDSWSHFGNRAYGVVRSHEKGSDRWASTYDCDHASGEDNKNMCHTPLVAGIFVLIFGILGVVVSFLLWVAVVLNLAGKQNLTPLDGFVPQLSNVQWVCLQGQVFLWSVSAHVVIDEQMFGSKLELSTSWILAFVCMLLAIVAAMFFAGGAGTAKVGAEGGAPRANQQPPV